jgi:molecular chaperone IbpA
MTLNDPFSFAKSLLPTTVGFDEAFRNLENVTRTIQKSMPSYPPYNIKKVADNKYVIELAVAGFGKQDLEMELKDGVLSIKGHTSLDTVTKDGLDQTYLYKGIADRAFTRQFTLADTIEIKNAELINGMLKVWLENIIPEHKKPKKIDITDKAAATAVNDQITDAVTSGAESTKQFLSEYEK